MFNFNLDLITPEFIYEKKTSSSPNVKRETENIGVIKLAHDDKSVRDQIDSFFNQNLFLTLILTLQRLVREEHLFREPVRKIFKSVPLESVGAIGIVSKSKSIVKTILSTQR